MAICALSEPLSGRQLVISKDTQANDFKQQVTSQMDHFAAHLLVMKGLSKGSINNHRKIVKKAIIETGIIHFEHADIKKYVFGLHGASYSYCHLVNTIRALEAFMEYLGDPIKLGRPKKPKRIISEVLTEAEIANIVTACRNIREKAIIVLLAYTGIRNQELCNVKVQDVDFGHNTVRVIAGKGSKSRVVHMSGDCTTVLLQYLSEYPRQSADYLFTSKRNGQQYATWSVRQLIKAIVSRTGIKKRVYPHLFRHSLATNMLCRGANLLTIKEQLGHAFIDTTMIYIQSRPQRV